MLIEFHLRYVKDSWVHCEISCAGTEVDTPAILYALSPTEYNWTYKKESSFFTDVSYLSDTTDEKILCIICDTGIFYIYHFNVV
jgi:hypothetical protein